MTQNEDSTPKENYRKKLSYVRLLNNFIISTLVFIPLSFVFLLSIFSPDTNLIEVIAFITPICYYFAYREVNRVIQCFEGDVAVANIDRFTSWFFNGDCFKISYSYNFKGENYKGREYFSTALWSKPSFLENYDVDDTIQVMVSTKNPKKSCVFPAYNKFDSEYSKKDFLKLAISSGISEKVADKVFDFLYMNNGYKTKPRLSDELDSLIKDSGNNSIYLPIFIKLRLNNPESSAKNMIISNNTVSALCIAINRIYKTQNGLL